MRIAIYARISRVTERTTSVERQIAHAQALAAQRQWTVADVYSDEGVSGALDPDDRPQMSVMLSRLGLYDAIVFYRIDRLARSTVAFADLMQRCQEAGVALVSVTEPMDLSTPMGRAMAEIIAVFARLERDMIKERSMDARRSLLEVGKFVGGRFPYGLTPVPHESGKGRILVRDEEAAPILRRMASMIIDGSSATQVAKWLNDQGVQTSRQRGATAKTKPADTYWRGNAVRAVLRNPQLIGQRRLPDGRTETGPDGMPLQVWEPVLTLAEWDAVQGALDALNGAPKVRRHDSHWLQPLTECAVCGYRLTQTQTHGHTGLKCARPNEQRHRPAPYIRLEHLESWVLETLRDRYGHMSLTERVWIPGSDHSAERGHVETAIRRMRADRDAGLFDGEEDERAFAERMAALLSRRRVLAGLSDTPGRWEVRDTGKSVLESLTGPDGATEFMVSAGLVVRVQPALGRGVPVGDRAVIETADPYENRLEEVLAEEDAAEA
ncbi:recombinase family protein [Streptomyces sp. YC504]|uniref:Recombinase family protein n=1 Tax=Streptomyces mesophilus TaxID=1775132 RepID=A0A6G4XG65_9ACTN|nr:recombinase family protein [Streptomyces mesophilus]NGO76172.1 recombinase family protein [Streptomyces mesophilus]